MIDAKISKIETEKEINDTNDTYLKTPDNKKGSSGKTTQISWRLIQTCFLFFAAYSILGWCYEVFLEVVVYQWGFSNRGFLWGPYCPVYGFGALIFIFSLKELKEKKLPLKFLFGWSLTPVLVFLAIVAITTGIELIASYVLEWATGGWLWDYEHYSFNFQGRIALNPSVRFGLGGMLIMYVIQPFLEKGIGKLSPKGLNGLFFLVAGFMGVDLLIKIGSLLF